jgi:hypothetical protein
MDLKQWQCKNKHALGMIQLNGGGSPQLMLYRHAVDLNADEPAEVDLMIGPLVGRMPVRCDLCDTVELWDISDQALAELILGLRPERLEKVQAYVIKKRVKRVQKKKNRAKI